MGTALSKVPARTPRVKLSLSKKKKKRKKQQQQQQRPSCEGFDSIEAPHEPIAPIKEATSPRDIDQSRLDLSLNSCADTRAQTCHWNKLPTELKLRVFSFLGIVIGDPIRHPALTGSKYYLEALNFRLVNKEFGSLYRDVWYKSNTFVVAPIWTNPLYHHRSIFAYPNPQNSRFIRSLQIELTVGWAYDGLEMLRCSSTDWCRLFRARPPALQEDESEVSNGENDVLFNMKGKGNTRHCACGASCAFGNSTTHWQDHFQSLDKLNIHLRVEGFTECSDGCSRSSHQLLQIFTNSVRQLMISSEIIVSAKNVEVRVHCDCERVAAYVQKLVQGKMTKSCS